MFDCLGDYYLILKALHLIFVISWMAAIFYLPRLFVYHAGVDPSSEMAQTFTVMERRLSRIIMTPAMTGSFVFGILLALIPGMMETPSGWFQMKVLLALLLAGFHGFLIHCHKIFASGRIPYSSRTFRFLNEVPTLIMIAIIFLVVFKPF